MRSPRPCSTRSAHSALAFRSAAARTAGRAFHQGGKRVCASGDGRDRPHASTQRIDYEHAERRTSYSDEIVAQLLPALVLLSANLPPDARAADQPHNLVLANRIRQYIGTHFTEQLTLEDIGEAMSMSPYHLAHIFKEITGMSPIHYMIRCRVGEAQNLLISTDYSATQIAAIVGYTNVNHFNAIFAKLVGLPPIRYRRKYLENMQGSRLQ